MPLTSYQSSVPFASHSQEIVTPDGFDVLRRVYVDFEGINFKRKFLTGLEPDAINVLIGKLFVLSYSS
jgi:histone-lysine N-methyltransferase MLL4